ncbi:MAG: ABC transporter permease [Terriglobia bacterium]
MSVILEGLKEAFFLLVRGDAGIWGIVLLSLKVSGSAVVLSMVCGIPAGVLLALSKFPGRKVLISILNTGMGLPPVAVGLFVTLLLWRSGPLGALELLYTPAAMVLAQFIIAFPIISGLTLASIQQLDKRLPLQILSLGASRSQMFLRLLREARLASLAAVVAGFGGVISEVGAVIMVGGNIKGQTRVLTTATVQEARQGHFEQAIAFGILLLLLAFVVNLALTYIQQRGEVSWERPVWK